MAALIETASQNCVKRLEFDEVIVEFYERGSIVLRDVESDREIVGGDLPAVPKRPSGPPHKLNQDYDKWTAATPGPIFNQSPE